MLRSELDAERSERQHLDNQRMQDVADIKGSITRTDTTMEQRIISHMESLRNTVELSKSEHLRKLEEQQGTVMNLDMKRSSEQTNEFKSVYHQISNVEGLVVQQSKSLQEAISVNSCIKSLFFNVCCNSMCLKSASEGFLL